MEAVLAELGALKRKRREPSNEATSKRRRRRPRAGDGVRGVLASVTRARAAAMRRDADAAVAHCREAARWATRLCEAAIGDNDAADVRRLASVAIRAMKELGTRSRAVDALSAVDATYHRLRYFALGRGIEVPCPREYFRRLLDAKAPLPDALDASEREALATTRTEIAAASQKFLGRRRHAIPPWTIRKTSWNPLLRLYRSRWRESAWLLSDDGPWRRAPTEPLVPNAEATPLKRRDPVAPKTLHAWRRLRDDIAREYSFAVPSEQALEALSRFQRVVEVGAGTGYWARCLRERRVEVSASDPDRAEYHGAYSTWTHVETASADAVLARLARRGDDIQKIALLVCYPPPDSALLGTLATTFAKISRPEDRLALVAEWRGDAASSACFRALADAYTLDDKIPLPNWGDTSAHLTLWRTGGGPCPLDTCSACARHRPLRRCRLTCDLQFCSSACAATQASLHEDLVALKLFSTHWGVPPAFNDSALFARLGCC